MTNRTERHAIKARRTRFDFSQTPLHWIPGDPFATHLVNGIHLLLPAGELWFCRVYNQALPLVTDAQLRRDVEGFIKQEAWHARAHIGAHDYLRRHQLNTDEFLARADRLFGDLLGDTPFGLKLLKREPLKRHWLVLRVGLIAAIEHFTGMLGQWAMDNKTWDKADPVMADLFRWHLAEEVEHRCVAYDLFEHLCRTQIGFYVSRQALMATVFPLFLYALSEGYRELAGQDRSDRRSRAMSRRSLLRLLLELEKVGHRTENVPPFSFLVAGALRWISPRFHPATEGDTQQALDYLARSPAARAALQQ